MKNVNITVKINEKLPLSINQENLVDQSWKFNYHLNGHSGQINKIVKKLKEPKSKTRSWLLLQSVIIQLLVV